MKINPELSGAEVVDPLGKSSGRIEKNQQI